MLARSAKASMAARKPFMSVVPRPVQPVVDAGQAKWIARPALTEHGHDIGMSGQQNAVTFRSKACVKPSFFATSGPASGAR